MDKLHKDVEPIIQSLIQEFKDSIQSLSKNEKAEESEEGASSFNEIAMNKFRPDILYFIFNGGIII